MYVRILYSISYDSDVLDIVKKDIEEFLDFVPAILSDCIIDDDSL